MIGEVTEGRSDGVERFRAMIFKLTDEAGYNRSSIGFSPNSFFFASQFACGIGIIDSREQFSVTKVDCACSRSCHIALILLQASIHATHGLLPLMSPAQNTHAITH